MLEGLADAFHNFLILLAASREAQWYAKHLLRYFFIILILSSGKAAIIEIETKSYEKDSGELLCINR